MLWTEKEKSENLAESRCETFAKADEESETNRNAWADADTNKHAKQNKKMQGDFTKESYQASLDFLISFPERIELVNASLKPCF